MRHDRVAFLARRFKEQGSGVTQVSMIDDHVHATLLRKTQSHGLPAQYLIFWATRAYA
jgi:hypothetical protein